MALCDTSTVLAENPCLTTLSPFTLEVVKTQLLCALLEQLNGGPDVSCDVATLLADGKCFYNVPQFVLQAVQVQLLCNIAAAIGGGGGGGANFLSGHGDPNGVTTGDRQGQTYLNLDTGALWSFGGTIGTNVGWV